jgi:hypothetical protein
MRGLLDQRLYSGAHQLETSSCGGGMMAGGGGGMMAGGGGGLLSKRYSGPSLGSPSPSSSAFTSASHQLSSLLNCASIAELTGSAGALGGHYDSKSIGGSAFDNKPMGVVGLTAFDKPSNLSGGGGGTGTGAMSAYESSGRLLSGVSNNNPYERWSNGSDTLFGLGGSSSSQAASSIMDSCGGYKDRLGCLGPQADLLADLVGGSGSSSKLLSGAPLSSNSAAGAPLYPPKSQIKRQKMIYHCKFGEFGILGKGNLILYIPVGTVLVK